MTESAVNFRALYYFTGRTRGEHLPIWAPQVPNWSADDAEKNLSSILGDGVIWGSVPFKSIQPAVCFSDWTPAEVRTALTAGKGPNSRGPYQPWGVIVDVNEAWHRGARPVWYVSEDEWKLLEECSNILPPEALDRRVMTKPGENDWTFEREWRWCRSNDKGSRIGDRWGWQLLRVSGIIVGKQGWNPSTIYAAAGGKPRKVARYYWNGVDLVDDGFTDAPLDPRWALK